MYIYLYLF